MTAPMLMDNGLPGSSSAISALLRTLMAPPQQAAPGGAAPGPQGPAPAGPAQGPDQTSGGLLSPAPAPMAAPAAGGGSMIDRIHDWLANHLQGNTPAGYEGLLSPEEMKSARPGLLSSIIGGPDAVSPQTKYRENLNNIVAMHGLATQMNENRRILQSRQQMAQLFPPLPNENLDQTRQRLGQMYEYAIAHGDTDMVKEIGSSLRGVMTAPRPDPTKVIAPGGALVGPDGKLLYQAPGMDKAGDYTQYVDPQGNIHVLKKDENPPPGWHTVPQSTAEIRIDASQANANASRLDRWSKQFDSNIKPLRDRAAVIDQAIKTIDDAAHNPNPAVRKTLYSSALANFIQAADQKAQIRYQLLNYYKQNVDPSIAGKWNVLKARLLQGTLPGYTMEGMITHLNNLKGLLRNEIDAQRSGLVKRHPALDSELPDTDEFFPQSSGSAGPAAPAPVSGGARTVKVNGKSYTLPH